MKYRILFFLIFIMGGLFFPVSARGLQNTIIPGVTLDGSSLGGQDHDQVLTLLVHIEKEIRAQKVYFKVPGGSEEVISLSYCELGVALDKEKIWEEGYSLGRKGKWWRRWLIRWEVKKKGHDIPLYIKIDWPTAFRSIQLRALPWEKEAQDARFMISSDDKVHILPEVYGQAVDMERIREELGKKLTVSQDGLMLVLFFRVIKPHKLKTDLEAYSVQGLVTKFSTKFNPAQKNRSRNIRLAVSALDGYLLEPGGVFSFNKVVGPRTKEKGYDEADTFLNYEVVPGVGGGVCQVSTTLYNAVLRSSLEVVERYPHSLMIRYVEPGRDATVAYESKDFRFRNNKGSYLLFKASASGDTLTFKIYGLPDSKTRVVIKSVQEKEMPPPTVFKEDPEVPKGHFILAREGTPGYIIRVERYFYDQEGKLLRSETISRDIYSPTPRVIMTSSSLLSN